METPDLLHVEVEKEDEIRADRADLQVTVKGSSVFSGAEAVQKAKEVNQLVDALTPLGLGADAVMVQGVRAEVQSGLFTKSSDAQYTLRVRVPTLAALPEVIELVATRKNATLDFLTWKYDGLEATLASWLTELLAQANAKAALVAEGLGVKVLGVHSFSEERWDPDRPPPITVRHEVMDGAGPPMAGYPMRRSMGGSGALAFEMAHSKKVRLVVRVDYRVGPRAQ
jgi:uncharacterized protein YggE